jgi:hypothetical protein
MTDADPPKDGDFAAYLARKQEELRNSPEPLTEQPPPVGPQTDEVARPQSIEDIVLYGQEPTDEFIEQWNEAKRNQVSEAELERQALEHPGADGDPQTPE